MSNTTIKVWNKKGKKKLLTATLILPTSSVWHPMELKSIVGLIVDQQHKGEDWDCYATIKINGKEEHIMELNRYEPSIIKQKEKVG